MWNGYETISRIFAASKEAFAYTGSVVYQLELTEKEGEPAKSWLCLSSVVEKYKLLEKSCIEKLYL